MMRIMDIRALSCFVAVAEHLNFARAAERMNTVQSAISQRIKALEQEIGVRLLDRSRHRVELTEAGRLFLVEVRRTLSQANEAVRVAREASSGRLGRLNLGFIDNVLWTVLPAILRTFRDRFPDVELGLQQLDRIPQIRALEDSVIDIGIMPAPSPGRGFASQLLLQAPFVAALPKSHRLATRKRLTLDELADEPFVLFPPTMQTRVLEIMLSACSKAGFIPKVSQEARQIHTLVALVSANLGITMVPKWVASSYPAEVVYRKISTPMETYGLVLTWRQESSNNAIQSFSSVAQEVVKALDFG
jgi:DNA-binding transcriptional LysR family regulator